MISLRLTVFALLIQTDFYILENTLNLTVKLINRVSYIYNDYDLQTMRQHFVRLMETMLLY